VTSDALDFLPAALEIQERPPSPVGRTLVWLIVAFFSIALVWAVFGRIDIVATAQGKIVPGDRVKIIQPMEIGTVRTIAVREDQPVKAGDLLVELDATVNAAELERVLGERREAQLDTARYRQLLQLSETGAPDDPATPLVYHPPVGLSEPLQPALLGLQTQLLRSAWREHRARLAALTGTLESRHAEHAATEAEIHKLESTLPLITRRANALKTLVDKQLGSRQSWLELEEGRIAQQQDLAVARSRLRQVAADIRETEQQRQALDEAFSHDTLTKLAEREQQLEQLEQEAIKARRRTGLQRLTSPVDGVVQQLAVHTVGGVVTPAQELMKVVPEHTPLEVEAWVLNRDVGFIEEGERAEVKIETFPFTKYGTIDGAVLDVSNDAVSDEHKGLVYAARVRLAKSDIQVDRRRVHLTPGMAVTVEVKTGQRRLIEFLLSPLLRYQQESLGER